MSSFIRFNNEIVNDNNSLIYYFICGDQIRNQVKFIYNNTIDNYFEDIICLLAIINDLKYQILI